MKTQTVEVKILGQKLSFKADADPELVHEVSKLVASRIKEAEARIKTGVPHHVALLALFDLAADFIQSRERAKSHQMRVDRKSREILKALDAELG